MEFEKVLEKRASVKKFSSKKPQIEKIIEAVHEADKAPAAGNLQIITYIIIEDPQTILKIADCCQQSFISTAPYVVIIVSDLKKIKLLYDKRAEKYVKHHVGAAVENFLLTITNMGLASSWVGAFSDPMLRSILKVPDDKEIEVILPVGHELIKGTTKQKLKHSLVNRIFYGGWGNKFHKPLKFIRRSDM